MTSKAASDWLASSLVALLAPAEGAVPGLGGLAAAGAASGQAFGQVSGQVLAPALLQANALPSRLAHPARLETWAGVAAGLWHRLLEVFPQLTDAGQPSEGETILHRHVSDALLRDEALGLGWIDGIEDPALPLCLAPEPLFASLLRSAGLVLLGPAIRQVIVRADLTRIEERLGAEAIAFVRRSGVRLWPGDGHSPRIRVDEVDQQVQQWGCALLARAFSAGAEPVARRGQLRLPPAIGPVDDGAHAAVLVSSDPLAWDAWPLPPTLSDPPQALALCRALIHELDAAWHSHFPALR